MDDIITRANHFLEDTMHLSYDERNFWEVIASSSYERIANALADREDICLLVEPGAEFGEFLLNYAGENHVQRFRRKLPLLI